MFNISFNLRGSGRHALCRKVREAEEESEVNILLQFWRTYLSSKTACVRRVCVR